MSEGQHQELEERGLPMQARAPDAFERLRKGDSLYTRSTARATNVRTFVDWTLISYEFKRLGEGRPLYKRLNL